MTQGVSVETAQLQALEWAGRRMRERVPQWADMARPEQLPPAGDWTTWLFMAGRGAGKTRAGSEWVHQQVRDGAKRIALVGATASDCRDVMVEGESGLLATASPMDMPVYEPSRRRLTWPNGAIASTYSAEEPDRLRGPQHDAAWCDELAAWRHAAAWPMMLLGLRLGESPRALVTTTPRPTKLVKELIGQPTTVVTRGSTYDNRENLAPSFLDSIIKRYENTRLGRQELQGEIIEDVEGALWTLMMLDELRVDEPPDLERIVVAVDPAVSAHQDSDETGIVAVGIGVDGEGYVLADRSCRLSPDGWGRRVVGAYHDLEADRVVVESNQGGDLVVSLLATVDPSVPVKRIHASRGKRLRAEPVAALYEQARVHHVGVFPELEDQMMSFTGDSGGADDRVDALVHGLTEAVLDGAAGQGIW